MPVTSSIKQKKMMQTGSADSRGGHNFVQLEKQILIQKLSVHKTRKTVFSFYKM